MVKTIRKRPGDESISAYHMAMMFWFKQAMPATWKAFDDKKVNKLTVWKKEGMLMVTGRAMEGLQHYFGVDYLPVFMSSSRAASILNSRPMSATCCRKGGVDSFDSQYASTGSSQL